LNALKSALAASTPVLLFALALSACELGLHEYQQATTSGCEAWQARCPAVLDYTGAGAINPARIDVDRKEIVGAAADAPQRQCDTVSLVCQGRIIGDVLRDQYLMVLAGNPGASATAAASHSPAPTAPAQRREGAPEAAGDGSTGTGAAASSRIVRTHGSRPGEVSPTPALSAPAATR
jgi:hypothetical protein